jgi:hypothetical protein
VTSGPTHGPVIEVHKRATTDSSTVAGDQAPIDEAVRHVVAEADILRFDQVGPVRGDEVT